jgi:hypothetical protein
VVPTAVMPMETGVFARICERALICDGVATTAVWACSDVESRALFNRQYRPAEAGRGSLSLGILGLAVVIKPFSASCDAVAAYRSGPLAHVALIAIGKARISGG